MPFVRILLTDMFANANPVSSITRRILKSLFYKCFYSLVFQSYGVNLSNVALSILALVASFVRKLLTNVLTLVSILAIVMRSALIQRTHTNVFAKMVMLIWTNLEILVEIVKKVSGLVIFFHGGRICV